MKNLNIGFTGTRSGMTTYQYNAVYNLLKLFKPTHVHHGDCVGSDENFHDLVKTYRKMHETTTQIVIHPPEVNTLRAHCIGEVWMKALPYLKRNQNIVNICDILIATPKQNTNQIRSGTWYTVRFAESSHVPVILVLPNPAVILIHDESLLIPDYIKSIGGDQLS